MNKADIWLDKVGKARIDVRCWFDNARFAVQAHVKLLHKRTGKGYWLAIGKTTVIDNPVGLRRRERARIKRACADMAAMEIGLEYTLRSKL